VLLAAAGLAAPAGAHAQTSAEVGLLNRLAPTVYVPNALALGSGAASSVSPDAVDGERALQARIPTITAHHPEAVLVEPASAPVNGAYALLGSSSALDARRRTIPGALR
jgi:hypothetical protein